jgi:hypothetical protein
MKIIRWPFVSLMFALLLVGFFLIGQKSSTTIRHELENVGATALDTVVQVGDLDLSVFGSYIHADDIEVTDPIERSKALFRASTVDALADLAGFAAQHIVLRQLAVSNAYLRLALLPNGDLQFLTDTTVDMSTYEPSILRASRVLTWATDQVNPFKISSTLPGDGMSPPAHGDVFELALARGGPDLVIRNFSLSDGTVELTGGTLAESLMLHAVRGAARELSSKPREHSAPITFSVAAFFGRGTDAWLAGDGTVDLRGGRTNIAVRFAVSNIALRSILPIVKLYTHEIDGLNIVGGLVDAHGRIALNDGVIMPSTVALKLREFTASTSGDSKYPWLNNLTVNNATLNTVVPIDNTPPYAHFETAFNQGRMSTKMENVDIRLNLQDIKKDFLDGMLR